jgi:hypothetical protein
MAGLATAFKLIESAQVTLARRERTAPGGRWSTGSATDAVADVCGLRRVDHPNDLQLEA